MRTETALECFHGVAVDVAHADVGGGLTRSAARQALVNRAELAGIAHSLLDERHVLVLVVRMVELRVGLVFVHHTYLDHASFPWLRLFGKERLPDSLLQRRRL